MKYLLFLLALPALAQFSGLTTNYDGSKLYFVSTLRQRNTTQPLHGKVFSLDDREMKPSLILEQIKLDDYWSNYYNILAPYLDASGALAGTNATRTCYIGFFQACKDFEGSTWQGTQYRGALTFSPNRRYALNRIWNGLSDYGYTLYDMTLNQRLATAVGFTSQDLVTNEGVVWRASFGGIQRLSAGSTAFEPFLIDRSRNFSGTAYLPGNQSILSWASQGLDSQLFEINTSTKDLVPVGPPMRGSCWSIDAAASGILIAICQSDDVSRLLRLDSPQAEWRTIATSIQSWTLSGDGSVIWYLSPDNAFHKVNLLAETDEIRLPPIGWLDPANFTASPGSLFYIDGEGIGDALLFIRHGSESTELIPVARRNSQLAFLIPSTFPFPLNEYTFEILNPVPSHFELRLPLSVLLEPVNPLFFTTPAGKALPSPRTVAVNPVAAEVDFSRLITRQNPARPGQIIHLWAVNLGPQEQGRLTTPNFSCFASDQLNPQILYVGPAPGITGLYQVSVRLPNSFPDLYPDAPTYYFSCGFGGTYPR
ncbi:MAG: hypothetical protein NTW74_03865, partial [Acidobacteria bacterium]|nr:hypothetical protein [Acidobacteriota bacterium]